MRFETTKPRERGFANDARMRCQRSARKPATPKSTTAAFAATTGASAAAAIATAVATATAAFALGHQIDAGACGIGLALTAAL